jgi:type IV secretion system protein VirB6
MSDCAALIAQAGGGVAPTLQAVDCMTASAGAGSFGHLLGSQGGLAPVLTAALTIYVAAYGLALITGRVRLAVNGLSGRMLTLGAVLAFATSWLVYGPLVYTLATRAPDEVAGAILGQHGSATTTFAQRIDTVFAAVGDATHQAAEDEAERNAQAAAAQQQAPGSTTPAVVQTRINTSQTAGFSPASVAQAAAIVLLLSTVGVLVTARIVLAALLLIGPLFVVMALFGPARGLFAGWLRTLALAAFAPMLVVLGGAFTLELAVPTVARLLAPDGIDQNAATGFFLIATVHAALMAMALRAAAGLVAGWKPWSRSAQGGFGPARRDDHTTMVIASPAAAMPRTMATLAGSRGQPATDSIPGSTRMLTTRDIRNTGAFPQIPAPTQVPGQTPGRSAGIGSRFRPATTRAKLILPVMK